MNTDDKVLNFSAIVAAEQRGTGVNFDLALTLVSNMIPLPVGLDVANERHAKLSQIDSTGRRLQTLAVKSLIKKPGTQQTVLEELGRKDGTRMFVVQEVYSSKGLTLTSDEKTKLGVTVGAGQAVPACPTVAAANAAGSAAAKPDAKAGSSGEQRVLRPRRHRKRPHPPDRSCRSRWAQPACACRATTA